MELKLTGNALKRPKKHTAYYKASVQKKAKPYGQNPKINSATTAATE